jgi:hypothetical protein
MIPSEMLAVAKVVRFAVVAVGITFLGGLGLALGAVAAVRLLATWGWL